MFATGRAKPVRLVFQWNGCFNLAYTDAELSIIYHIFDDTEEPIALKFNAGS